MSKITITAVPVFRIRLCLEDAILIQSEARAHYDGACRSTAEVGGFIYGWISALSGRDPADEVPPVSATFRELDLLMKIIENSGYGLCTANQVEVIVLRDLAKTIRKAMEQSTKLSCVRIEVN